MRLVWNGKISVQGYVEVWSIFTRSSQDLASTVATKHSVPFLWSEWRDLGWQSVHRTTTQKTRSNYRMVLSVCFVLQEETCGSTSGKHVTRLGSCQRKRIPQADPNCWRLFSWVTEESAKVRWWTDLSATSSTLSPFTQSEWSFWTKMWLWTERPSPCRSGTLQAKSASRVCAHRSTEVQTAAFSCMVWMTCKASRTWACGKKSSCTMQMYKTARVFPLLCWATKSTFRIVRSRKKRPKTGAHQMG